MSKLTSEEVDRELDMEFLFERESLAYKLSRGVSGMQINARVCPACGDGRWRVYLNAETGRGNCFVCNETFSKMKFIKAHFECEWSEAFDHAREILKDQGWRPKRMISAAVDIPDDIKLPFSEELPIDGQNLVYLEQRGISAEMAAYFHLRYCQFGWWEFTGDEGDKRKQFFSNRVIIPVFDLDGTLKTFQGRDITGTAERKYLFPIGIAGTGKFLLNGQNVSLTKELAMGEGAFDVIAIKMAFDEDVAMRHIVPVGSFGKHLSYGAVDGDDQLGRFIKLKAQGIQIVTIMWDGEEKATLAALNAAKILTGIGLKVRIALLPPDKDPNEVLPEVVRAAYHAAHMWTPKLDLQWRLRNPYSVSEVRKYFPSAKEARSA